MTTTIGSKPRTGPKLRVGDRVVLVNAGSNVNGTVGTVERLNAHTCWVRYKQGGREWVSPHRHWQVAPAPERSACEAPRVCPTCGQEIRQ